MAKLTSLNPVKKRNKKPKTEEQKELKKLRESSPSHVIEMELMVDAYQHKRLQKAGEHLRQIRNTVLSQLLKHYQQMVRTKRYRNIQKAYGTVCNQLEQTPDPNKRKKLELEKEQWKKEFTRSHEEFQVTFEFARKYGEFLRKEKFTLPDSVTVLSAVEMAWDSISKLLFHSSRKVYFYKSTDLITFQGKQAERSILLKYHSPTQTSSTDRVFPSNRLPRPCFQPFKDDGRYFDPRTDELSSVTKESKGSQNE